MLKKRAPAVRPLQAQTLIASCLKSSGVPFPKIGFLSCHTQIKTVGSRPHTNPTPTEHANRTRVRIYGRLDQSAHSGNIWIEAYARAANRLKRLTLADS